MFLKFYRLRLAIRGSCSRRTSKVETVEQSQGQSPKTHGPPVKTDVEAVESLSCPGFSLKYT